jgi:hypothetical protein
VAPGNGRGSAHGRGSGADTGGRRAAGEEEHVTEEEDEGRRSEGPHWKLQNLRDFTVNRVFPTDPNI